VVVAESVEASTTVTSVAGTPPMVTDAPPEKSAPVMETEVPPMVGPPLGEMPDTETPGGVG